MRLRIARIRRACAGAKDVATLRAMVRASFSMSGQPTFSAMVITLLLQGCCIVRVRLVRWCEGLPESRPNPSSFTVIAAPRPVIHKTGLSTADVPEK